MTAVPHLQPDALPAPRKQQRRTLSLAVLALGLAVVAVGFWLSPLRTELALQTVSEPELRLLSEREPNNPRVSFMLGRRAQAAGHLDSARSAYLRAYTLDPDHEESCLYAAYCADLLQNQGQALRLLSGYVRTHPRSIRARFALAKLYHRLNFPGNALIHVEPVVRAEPNNAKAWYLYGLTLRWGQRYAQARDAFQRACFLAPTNAEMWLDLAKTEAKLNRLDAAEADYRRALTLAPKEPAVLAQMAGFLFEKMPSQEHRREAEELFQKALAIQPQDSYSLYTLARIYIARRDPVRAIPCLQAALRIRPGQASGWYALATAYLQAGDPKRSQEARTTSTRLRLQYEAEEKLIESADQNPTDFDLHLRVARYYTGKPNSETAALNQYFLCHQLQPDNRPLVKELNAYAARLQQAGKMPSVDLLHAIAEVTGADATAYQAGAH